MPRRYPTMRYSLLSEAAIKYSKGGYLDWEFSLSPEDKQSLSLEFDEFHKQVRTIKKLVAMKSLKSAGEKFEYLFEEFGIGLAALGLIITIDRGIEVIQ